MALDLEVAPGHFRFRAEPEPGTDPGVRRWRATYSHPGGWSGFAIAVDIARNTCTIHRGVQTDYSQMLRDLSRTLIGTEVPVQRSGPRSTVLTLDCELIGLKMSRAAGAPAGGSTGPFRTDPPGGWLVVQVFVPRGRESFFLGLNEKQASGEIVPADPEHGAVVFQTLTQLFA